jgi:hypothetical protein
VAVLSTALSACGSTKDELFVPAPLEEHPVKIDANAEGDLKSPAHVAVFMQRGSLHIRGGAESTVQGLATGGMGDPPPRVTLTLDRVAITQTSVGGAAPKGDARFALRLGATPMILEVETGAGQDQAIDLGGVALVEGRLHTDSGRIALEWSSPNALPTGALKLKTEKGYVEVGHLGRLGGGSVDVTANDGFVSLEIADIPRDLLSIGVELGRSKLVVTAPMRLSARADIAPGNVATEVSGWAALGPAYVTGGSAYVLGDAAAAPRLTLRVQGDSARVELRAE